MARLTRFVKTADEKGQPLVTRLPLSDGDWIEVKPRLSIGELQTIETSSYRAYHQVRGASEAAVEPRIEVDLAAFGLVRNFMWLVSWSLRDESDKPVACTIQALAALDPEDFTEIENAITAHITALAAEKKRRALAKTVSPSTSADGSAQP